MRFKIDWASLRVGSKFTVFALSPPPPGTYIWRGGLTEVFLRYRLGGPGLYLEGLILGILRYFIPSVMFHLFGSRRPYFS